MEKQAVNLVIRARPTAAFASMNIKLDPLTGVCLDLTYFLDYCCNHRQKRGCECCKQLVHSHSYF